MKLGISNLIWDNIKTSELVPILVSNNIKYVEVILSKHITKWNDADLSKLQEFHNYLECNHIYIKSTQSLFHNSGITSYYNEGFIDHLIKVSDICKNIGITQLVLGAPTMRKENNPFGLDDKFSYINSILRKNNQTLLLEPNSRVYGGNYFYRVDEIVLFIDEMKFSNIKTMIDTHNIILEGEDPSDVFIRNRNYIKHIHVSEINLGGFINSEYHNKLSKTLKEFDYDGLVIYEAKPTNNFINEIKNFSKNYNI